jgi:hypothetical protein
MIGKLAFSSLAAAVASDYVELNLDNRVGEDASTTEYYKDSSSIVRVPTWMRNNAAFEDWVNLDGSFALADNSHSAVYLGDGDAGVGGSSSVEQADFIETVRNHHRDADGNLRVTPFAADGDASRNPYFYADEFWLRDGHLFAKIDSSVASLVHGNVQANMQDEVMMRTANGGDSYDYMISPQSNHIEHMREFCNLMGGDLWSPSSQTEYDDLMERDGGVCDKNRNAQVYMNIHRDGYMGCPVNGNRVDMDDESDDFRRSCPEMYGQNTDQVNSRSMNDNAGNNAQFKTTDAWFADSLSTGMCTNPSNSMYHYSAFSSLACDQSNNDADVPFMGAECWTSSANMRFQKFSENNNLNKVSMADSINYAASSDCVVASCGNSVSNDQSGSSDVRVASSWNSATCNQAASAICRIRAFGCSDVEYTCKAGYSRSCGARSVMSKTIVAWADSSVQVAEANMMNAMNDADLLSASQLNTASMITLRNSWAFYDVVSVPHWYGDSDKAATEIWIASNSYLASNIIIEQQVRARSVAYPTCDCQCNSDGSLLDFNNLVAQVSSLALDVDVDRSLGHIIDNNAFRNAINDEATWSCNDPHGCYSGSFKAQCRYETADRYQATWAIDESVSGICVNSCCGQYVDEVHEHASMTSARKHNFAWQAGDAYTITCENDYHIMGAADDVTSVTHTITSEDVAEGTCFDIVRCTRNIPEGQCGQYFSSIHSHASMSDSSRADPAIWQEDDSYTITCDAGNHIKGSTDDDTSYTRIISAEDITNRACFRAIECCKITSYSDATSAFRAPNWMRNSAFSALLNDDNIQVGDIWHSADSAIHLGNGRIIADFSDGTSTSAEVNVVSRVKNFHNPNGASTNFAHADGGNDPWNHISDYYLRDGYLFALIEDDSVNKMIHGYNPEEGNTDNMQKDIRLSNTISGSTYTVTREEYHMEHLREFCTDMGGDLWMPSSQQEYEDIMETGVCNRDFGASVYLNLHKEGYLGCPIQGTQVVNDELGLELFCPDQYGENERDLLDGTPIPSRNMNVNHNWRTFRTTDAYFSESMADMCARPTFNDYVYGNYGCQATSDMMRFQKFSRQDTDLLTDILSETLGSNMYQSDCVVASCTGTDNNSEWRMSQCNRPANTGICRIRAFGCSDSVYNCKTDYNRSCGDRTVYTKTVANWLSFEMDLNVDNLIQSHEDCTIELGERVCVNNLGDVKKNMALFSTIPQYREDTMTGDVISIPSTYDNEDFNSVEVWRETIPELEDITRIERRSETKSYETCNCHCVSAETDYSEVPLRTWANFRDHVAGVTLQSDVVRNLRHDEDWDQIGNLIGNEAIWRCNDDFGCYSGNFGARCTWTTWGFEASWRLADGMAFNACVNNCCDAYTDDIHVNARLVVRDTNRPSIFAWRAGDEYTIQCDTDHHIRGSNNDDTFRTYTIPEQNFFDDGRGSCFTPVVCDEIVPFDLTTSCNNYDNSMHSHASLTSDMPEGRDHFISGDIYTISCVDDLAHFKFGAESVNSRNYQIEVEQVMDGDCFDAISCCRNNLYTDESADRTPDWMKLEAHSHFLNGDGVQQDGVWNDANTQINLQNGKHFSAGGSSSWAQVDFIDAVKNHHRPAGALTNFAAVDSNSRDAWTNSENFWYRDGHIFALVDGNKANFMTHNGAMDLMQRDVVYHSNIDGGYDYQVKPEFSHIEHLRSYCNVMGGDLWAPSSEHEYNDIMDNGVCAQDNSQSVYLNLNRHGALSCPSTSDRQLAWTIDGENTFYACPSGLDNLGNHDVRDLRSSSFRSFLTTDPWFAHTLGDGMCDAPNLEEYVYGYFGCYALEPQMERFHRFAASSDDDLTNVNHDGEFVQKDCVVATCGNGITESSWHMAACNQANTNAVCRVRAFGCDAQTYTCLNGYSRSCGDRSVYTKAFLPWADSRTQSMYNNLYNEYDVSNLVNERETSVLARATIPSYRLSLTESVIAVPSNYENAQISEVFSWRNLNDFLDSSTTVERRLIGFNYPTCTCECHNDNDLENWLSIRSFINVLLDTDGERDVDNFRDLRYTLDRNIDSNRINDVSTWSCNDEFSCYTGEFSTQCRLTDGGYEASWGLTNNIVGSCVSHCCEAYNPDRNTFATIDTLDGNSFYGWRAGDSYTINCNEDLHVQGAADDVTTFTHTITNQDVADLNCFKSVTCVNVEVFVPPSCNNVHNNEIHENAEITSVFPESWITGTEYTITCDAGFHIKDHGDDVTFRTYTITLDMIENETCWVPTRCCRIHHYDDHTSNSRIPEWMHTTQFNHWSWNNDQSFVSFDVGNDRFTDHQISNENTAWDAVDTAINLGNGIRRIQNDLGTWNDGTSNADEVNFIDAIKYHHNPRFVDRDGNVVDIGPETPFANPATGSFDPFHNVDNFWYRDGHLFAEISSDVANVMMHGNNFDRMQSEVYINNDNDYEIRKETHHLEHLRSYCNEMGGDLWMPSSEQEYADIMESDDGFCANNFESEIYMNVHRKGYMGCPNNNVDGRQEWSFSDEDGNIVTPGLDCPNDYDENYFWVEETIDEAAHWQFRASRTVDVEHESIDFRTTDSWFSNDMYEDGMCARPNLADYFYSNFGCMALDTNMRFNRFPNSVMDNTQSVRRSRSFDNSMRATEDCVVARCNSDRSSTWSMEQCNRPVTTGICRIRAFGCDDPTYSCYSTRSCGDRSTYVRDRNEWASSSVALTAASLAQRMVDDSWSVVDERFLHNSWILSATIPTYRSYVEHNVVMVPWNYDDADINAVSIWALGSAIIPSSEFDRIRIDRRRIDEQDDFVYPTCTCTCQDDVGTSSWEGMAEIVNNLDHHIDVNRGLALFRDADNSGNIIDDHATWSCTDNFGCYSGEFSASCQLNNGAYQASWGLHSSHDACVNSCCAAYDASIHTHASMTVSDNNRDSSWSWRAGDTYTITCDNGHHIFGESDGWGENDDGTFDGIPAVRSRSFEISEDDVFRGTCFPTVRCVEIIIPDPKCEPYVDNHVNAQLVNWQDEWNEGHVFTIRCDGNLRLIGQPNDVTEITREVTSEMINSSSCFPRVTCVPKVCSTYTDNIHFDAWMTNVDIMAFNWEAGMTYSIGCRPGYYRFGFNQAVDVFMHTITDQDIEDNTCWQSIQCVERTCEDYNDNMHSFASMVDSDDNRDFDDWRVGHTYTVQCDLGYYIDGLSQEINSIDYEISENEVFTRSCFTPIRCVRKTCRDYTNTMHSNAAMTGFNNPLDSAWTWGESYTIQCNTGYYMVNQEQNIRSHSHTITLQNVLDQFCWQAVTCVPRTCGVYDPSVHTNALLSSNVDDWGYIIDTEYTVSCREGYYIAANNNHASTSYTHRVTLANIDDGNCFPRITCAEMLCENEINYWNAAMSSSNRDDDDVWGWGDSYTVTCIDGYHVEGSNWDIISSRHVISLNNVINRNCFPSIRCVEISCEANSNSIHANAFLFQDDDHSGIYYNGDDYLVVCQPGYYISGQEYDITTWDYSITLEDVNNRNCFKPVVCLPRRCEEYDHDMNTNAIMTVNSLDDREHWIIGDSFTISCADNHHITGSIHSDDSRNFVVDGNNLLNRDCFAPVHCSENICETYNDNMHFNAHMVRVVDDFDDSNWRLGDSYIISCEEGYYVAGGSQEIDSVSVVIDSEQTFSRDCFNPVTCLPRTCEEYDSDNHTNAALFDDGHDGNHLAGEEFIFVCQPGYYLSGNDYDVTTLSHLVTIEDVNNKDCYRPVVCLPRRCEEYDHDIHTNAIMSDHTLEEREHWELGDSFTISCADNHHITGSIHSDDNRVYVVGGSSLLNRDCFPAVHCSENMCEDYNDGIHFNAAMSSAAPREEGAWRAGDVYTISCIDGYYIAGEEQHVGSASFEIDTDHTFARSCFAPVRCLRRTCSDYSLNGDDIHINAHMSFADFEVAPLADAWTWAMTYTVSCTHGYHIFGEEIDSVHARHEITMEEVINGQCWQPLHCVEIFCPPYDDDIHSNANMVNHVNQNNGDDEWYNGESYGVQCHPGHYIAGEVYEIDSRNFTLGFDRVMSQDCFTPVHCVQKTCQRYSDDIHIAAVMADSEIEHFNFRVGDNYTVTCDRGMHVADYGYDIMSMDFTVTFDEVEDQTCFPPVECRERQCPCVEKDHGYCYNVEDDDRFEFGSGSQLVCKCDEGYVNINSIDNLPYDIINCQGGDWIDIDTMGQCVPITCTDPYELLDDNDNVIGLAMSESAIYGECIEYRCADGYEPAQSDSDNRPVNPMACCDFFDYHEDHDEDRARFYPRNGRMGFFGHRWEDRLVGQSHIDVVRGNIVGTCRPITSCGPPPQVYGAWSPLVVDSDNLNGFCHSDSVYSNRADYFLDHQFDERFMHGEKAVYECFDDYMAYKRDDFQEWAMDISEELYCAQGNAHDHLNEDFSVRREKDTNQLISEALQHIEDENHHSYRLAGRNDKIVARCVNGNWIMPSHECICQEEKDRREMSVDRFEMTCVYEDTYIRGASQLSHRYAMRSNNHHHNNNEQRRGRH